jgi:hypothetical protein
MNYEIRRCRAPRRGTPQSGLECGNEFEAFSMNKIYCCTTCRNRALKHAYINRKRGLGYGLGTQTLRTPHATTFDPQKVQEAKTKTTADVERAIIMAPLYNIDSEKELGALGYRSDKKAERWSDSEPSLSAGPKAPEEANRTAEPHLPTITPTSTFDSPPQFINEEYEPSNPDDPYGDYVPPESGEL